MAPGVLVQKIAVEGSDPDYERRMLRQLTEENNVKGLTTNLKHVTYMLVQVETCKH